MALPPGLRGSGGPAAPEEAVEVALDALAEPVVVAPEPPSVDLTPRQWVRANLFPNVPNGILTVLFAAIAAWSSYRLAYWVLVTADWAIVRANLRLFMIGRFPADQLWRLWASITVLMATAGFALGVLTRAATDRDLMTGTGDADAATAPPPRWKRLGTSVLGTLQRFWPALLALGAVLALTRTFVPALLALGLLPVFLLTRAGGVRVRPGTSGWFVVTVALGLVAASLVGLLLVSLVHDSYNALGTVPQAILDAHIVIAVAAAAVFVVSRSVQGRRNLGVGWLWLMVAAGVVLSMQVVTFGSDGVSWDRWGGLYLAVFATVAGITLAFPLGLLVALGRQAAPLGLRKTLLGLALALLLALLLLLSSVVGWFSYGVLISGLVLTIPVALIAVSGGRSLPGIRVLSTAYAETFRAVPLVTLLFLGHQMVRFVYPTSVEPPSFLARAIIAITLFQSAYIAEIVRGGLQGVSRGQVEAAQAIGLAPTGVMRMVVLPQALRSVIPAMVGQFISLFKDTSLLSLIGFFELLDVAYTVTQQDQFRGQGLHVVTLAFVGFLYWAGCSTMSRESGRLERRLGVGER